MAKQDASLHEHKSVSNLSSQSSLTLPMAQQSTDHHADLEKSVTVKDNQVAPSANRAVTALDWTGPDDPENPENWSAAWKAYHVAYVGLQCFVM